MHSIQQILDQHSQAGTAISKVHRAPAFYFRRRQSPNEQMAHGSTSCTKTQNRVLWWGSCRWMGRKASLKGPVNQDLKDTKKQACNDWMKEHSRQREQLVQRHGLGRQEWTQYVLEIAGKPVHLEFPKGWQALAAQSSTGTRSHKAGDTKTRSQDFN